MTMLSESLEQFGSRPPMRRARNGKARLPLELKPPALFTAHPQASTVATGILRFPTWTHSLGLPRPWKGSTQAERFLSHMSYHFHRGDPVNCLRAGTGMADRNAVERLQDSPPDLRYGGEIWQSAMEMFRFRCSANQVPNMPYDYTMGACFEMPYFDPILKNRRRCTFHYLPV
jgi:hypothetical protein